MQSRVVGHAGEPVAELGGGNTGDSTAERFAASAAPHGFAACVPGVSEVQVFYYDCNALLLMGDVNQLADGCSQAPVAGGCGKPRQVERDDDRLVGGVAVSVEDEAGQVVGIQVNSEDPLTDDEGRHLWDGDWRAGCGGPRGIDVPPASPGIPMDVVPDGGVRFGSISPLPLPAGERGGRVQHVPAPGRVRICLP
ncbi:hypothetical protein ACFT7S_24800 [Streptomyces sp. NPDC057136]|uniref:hypothetical protein n=1 Tax=Streptomyces sp. NPDC057136 TaxID=3346029 RepID=UPI0036276B56